ncbi:MAG: uroporphyrinogen decarboxylase family protein [Anaerolineae bacterium]
MGPKEQLARRTLAGEWAGRAPAYDLLCSDAAISFYAGETLTLANAAAVVPRAVGNALDATRLALPMPRAAASEHQPDGSIWEHRRWTSWLRQGPVTDYDSYRAAMRRSAAGLLSDWSDEDQRGLDRSLATYLETKALLGDVLLLGNLGTKAGFMALFSPNYLEYMGYLIADDLELVDRVYEANTSKSVQRVAHLPEDWAEVCPAVFIGEDMAYKAAPMVSPGFLRQHYWPRLERIVDAYHAKGIKVVFHSDGNLMPVLDDLVAIGVDGLNPIEVAAGMNPVDLRRRWPRLLLFGGIGYSSLLAHGTPAEVAAATRRAIAGASPGYFVGSDTELGDDIPLDNIRAMFDTAMES